MGRPNLIGKFPRSKTKNRQNRFENMGRPNLIGKFPQSKTKEKQGTDKIDNRV